MEGTITSTSSSTIGGAPAPADTSTTLDGSFGDGDAPPDSGAVDGAGDAAGQADGDAETLLDAEAVVSGGATHAGVSVVLAAAGAAAAVAALVT